MKHLKVRGMIDINPVGVEVDFVYDYEWNRFNDEGEYEIEDGSGTYIRRF